MDELLKELEKLKDVSAVFSMWDVALALTLSFVLQNQFQYRIGRNLFLYCLYQNPLVS